MEPKNYEGIYIVDAEWLANHRKEHYDIEGDEVTFSTLPYVTFEDIYEDAEHINIPLAALREKADFVRCKHCEYWQDNNGGYPHEECRWGHDETPDADDFCSYGRRLEVKQP